VILAACSALGGLVNLPFHPHLSFLENWLRPVFGSNLADYHFSSSHQWVLAIGDGVLAVAGVVVAYALWRTVSDRPALEPTFLQRAWMIDFSYDRLIAHTSTRLSQFSAAVVDNRIIDGAVNGAGRLTRAAGRRLRRVQTGYVRNYALGIVGGLFVILAFLISRASS